MNQQYIQFDFLTLQEAGNRLGITAHSLNDWLNNHKDIKEKYCCFDHFKRGKGRKKILILEEALLVITNIKDSFRGNRKKAGNQTFLQEGKKKLANYAAEKITSESILLQTAKIIEQLQGRIEKLEGSNIEQKLLPEKIKIHDPLRQLLVVKINDYAKATGAGHRDLWNLLYRTYFRTYGVDLRERAIVRNMGPLDIAEQDKQLKKLYELASQMYKSEKSLII